MEKIIKQPPVARFDGTELQKALFDGLARMLITRTLSEVLRTSDTFVSIALSRTPNSNFVRAISNTRDKDVILKYLDIPVHTFAIDVLRPSDPLFNGSEDELYFNLQLQFQIYFVFFDHEDNRLPLPILHIYTSKNRVAVNLQLLPDTCYEKMNEQLVRRITDSGYDETVNDFFEGRIGFTVENSLLKRPPVITFKGR